MQFVSSLFWLFFIVMAVIPMIRQSQTQKHRYRALRALEKKRGSRVIALIHRQESISFLGIPISKYINIEDSEQIMRAIRLTPDDMPIDIILHTPGGLVLASDQIAHAIQSHPAKVTVFVPHYAMSGGTMIGLAADELMMDPNAVLGSVDPQIKQYPASSILKVLEEKDINEVDDETIMLADIAQKAIKQVEDRMYRLLISKMEEDRARDLAKTLTEGRWTHDYPIGCQEMMNLGLSNVCGVMPEEIYEIMDLFPQPVRQQSSVSYVPVPYNRENNG